VINAEKTKYLCTGEEITAIDIENGDEIQICKE
jgi:hypothetical protein